MVNGNHKCCKIYDVLLQWVGQMVTMKDQTRIEIRCDFPRLALMRIGWKTSFPTDGPSGKIHKAKVRVF